MVFDRSPANYLTAPIIYGMIVPLALFDLCISFYPANRTLPFQLMADMFERRLPQIANDRVGQENVVRNRGVGWTIVKPPRLTDRAAKGKWLAGPEVRVGLLSSISRNDLADFLLAETLMPQHIGQAVFIRN